MVINTIGIIGRICSGKSTMARNISSYFSMPILSFGSYLAKYSRENNLPTDRGFLQNLGNNFIKEDSNAFLRNVINTQQPFPDSMIIEGIRHLAIQKELVNISKSSIFIFVEADLEVRYSRYCNREKQSDKAVSLEEFIETDNHAVESEIDLLRDKCAMVIDTNNFSEKKLFNAISSLLS